MFILVSADRYELEVSVQTFDKLSEARKQMLRDAAECSNYTIEEIKEMTLNNSWDCDISENGGYIQTTQWGTVAFEIKEVRSPYVLISVDREDLNIRIETHNTHKEAYNSMKKDIQKVMDMSFDALVDLSNSGEGYIGNDGAWFETRYSGTMAWDIKKL